MRLASARTLDDASKGRYELERELARGGMGVVYQARDRATGQTLALKRCLGEEGRSAAYARSMLQREYQTLIALRHPHIIRVYDFGVDESGPYYTMELLHGADLRAKCPLPWREVCAYLRDVASSLALLHSRRLLHCDVSVANIWLTNDNRAKLLDFGALASFGRNTTLAGSPPTTAPEALADAELDQRVDLYALGASAYYALTGRHAYPATVLALLPALWSHGAPPAPSSYVTDIPQALDELVLALLERDRLLRPASAAEVMDRLEAIANLAPDRDPRIVSSYLQSTVIVGRDAQRRALSHALEQVLNGRPQEVLIEGTLGLGKSCLLEDFLREAQVAGARVLTVHARAHAGPREVWAALAREAGVPTSNLHVTGVGANTHVEERLVELSAVSPIVVSVEDLQEADTESLAALVSFAKSAERHRTLVIGTLDPEHPQAARPAIRLLRSRFKCVRLSPFDEKTTQAFVSGLFGDVSSSSRLATFLYERASGNPHMYRAMIDHLIGQGAIRYEAGIWILPAELSAGGPYDIDLAALVQAAFESRVARWPAAWRALARALSPARRPFALPLCQIVASDVPVLDDQNVSQTLDELVREGVLVDDHGSYMFGRKHQQEFFYAQLTKVEKEKLHLCLAEYLEENVARDDVRTYEIGYHFLLAGREKQARKHLNRRVDMVNDIDTVLESVPELRALWTHLHDSGASDMDLQFIENRLMFTGYYVDPSSFDTFGERCLRNQYETSGFALATRLGPWLGRHLAFAIGLFAGWVSSLKRRYLLTGGSYMIAVLNFVGICAVISVASCFRYDLRPFPLLYRVLGPTSKFGRLNPLRVFYEELRMSEDFLRGRLTRLRRDIVDHIERCPHILGMTEENAHHLVVGLTFSLGLNSLQRMGTDVPAIADRIEALASRQDRLQAQFLRYQYHLYRGEVKAQRREEERYDEMSTELGSRWRMDVVDAVALAPYHWTADVLGLKRCVHRIELLIPIAPGLPTPCAIARAMYEGHRGRPDLALRRYEEIADQLTPFAQQFWSVALGHKAECLNALGRHTEALALCEEALSQLGDEDRQFVFHYLQLERERAQALAGLGRLHDAAALADALLAEFGTDENLVIRCMLHFDRARIARRAGDAACFEAHAQAARADAVTLENPAAIARINRLFEGTASKRNLGRAGDPGDQQVATLRQLVAPMRQSKAVRVLDEIVGAVRPRAATLCLLVFGRAVVCATHGSAGVSAEALSELVKVAASFETLPRGSGRAPVLTELPSEVCRERVFVPLVAKREGGDLELVAWVALDACERPGAISQLDLGALAAELAEVDDVTESLVRENA